MRNKYKLNFTLPLLFFLFIGLNLKGQAPDLFISEYIEGSSNNKALEIYNGTGAQVSLDGYFLIKVSNPSGTETWADGSVFSFTGGATVADGDVYVVYNSSAVTDITSVGDESNTVTYFNGNDPIALIKDVNANGTYEDGTDEILDVIGDMTNTTWGAELTWVRQDTYDGNTTFTLSEWDEYAQDEFSYLGSHTYSSGPDTEAPTWVDPAPYVEKVIENRFDLVAALNETGTVYYKLMNDGEAAPSIAEIMSANSLTISQADSEFSVTSSDTLSTATAYDLYVVAEDDAGNAQANDTLIEFTTSDTRTLTLDRPAGGETLYAGDMDSIMWTQSNVDYVNIKIYDPNAAEWFYPGEEYMKADATTGKLNITVPPDAMTSSGYRAAIMDWADETLADSGSTFTIMDTIRPVITEMHPAHNATDVSIQRDSLVVGFSEAVTIGTGNITIKRAADSSIFETIDVTGGNVVGGTDTSAIIRLSNSLEQGTTYFVNAEEGVCTDMSGNNLAAIDDAETWVFTTEEAPPAVQLPVTKDFEDQDLNSGGWTTQVVVGSMDWYIGDYSGYYAEMSNYDGGNQASETWLISPAIDLSSVSNAVFSFDNACKWSGPDIEVLISTDYDGLSEPGTATWDALSPNLSTGSYNWVNSGTLNISSYTGGTAYIAFKYTGSDSDGKTWQIDNIEVKEPEGPTIDDTYIDPDAPTSSDDVYVYADVNDLAFTLDSVYLAYGTTSGELNDTLGMIETKQWYQNDVAIPAFGDETTVYYQITAVNNNNQETVSDEMSYTVYDPATMTLPYAEMFGDDLGEIYPYSLSGDGKGWYHSSDYGVAAMNGDGNGETDNDWLVIPGIDFTQYSNDIKMSFSTWYNYGGDDSENWLKLKYSTDYSGTGDPSAATWTEISFPQPDTSYTWKSSGVLDLPDTSSTNVYLAFQYRYVEDSSRLWEIDSLNIYDAAKPVIKNYTHLPSIPVVSDQVDIQADVTDAVGIDSVYAAWGTTSGNLTDTIGMSVESGDTYITDSKIPEQTEGTTVYYKIFAINNNSVMSETVESDYTVISYPELSIYEIQYSTDPSGDSPEIGNTVITSGIVTAIVDGGYFIQDGQGPWNGVYVYDSDNSPSIGDKVEFNAKVDEFYNLTELKNVSGYTLVSSNNDLPLTDTITTGQAKEEAYESVLIRMIEAECTEAPNNYGQWKIFNSGDTVLVDDEIFQYTPTVEQLYNITGIGYYTFEKRVVLPRSEDDIVIAGNAKPEVTLNGINPPSPTDEDDVQVNADITDPDGDAISATLFWGTASDAMTNEVSFTATGVGDQYTGTIPAQSADTHVYFKIEAEDGKDTTTVTGDYTVESSTPPDGIEDLTELDMEVYPNPSNGQFNIVVNENTSDNFRIAVFNISGQLVYQSEFNAGQESRKTINITNLSDGVYYLQVRSDKAIKVIKLLKQ
jgi:hypothetical protein